VTVEIALSDMWVYLASRVNDKLPLSRAAERGAHVHGRLIISVAGRQLPRLGYWGPSDVCMGMWIGELSSVIAKPA
jgi:hypothetical protein